MSDLLGPTPMLPHLKQACIAFVIVAASVTMLSLSAPAGHAQKHPFAELPGSWSGRGNITLSSGSHERIHCRATYAVRGAGNDLHLALRCASDSYSFDFRATGRYGDGTISGSWNETIQRAAGSFTGSVNGNHISVRAEGPTFAALLDMTTHSRRQSILIRSPGSKMSEVTIVLSRR
jgi:hypothetical protein